MGAANDDDFTQQKVVSLEEYKKRKAGEHGLEEIYFDIGQAYRNIEKPELCVRVIGQQTIAADFTIPSLYLSETCNGDIAVLLHGDEILWEAISPQMWADSVPDDMKKDPPEPPVAG